MSRFWSATFRVAYWILTRLGPMLRPWAKSVRLGNVVELVVPGRVSGRRRVVLLGLLRLDEEWYIGHPNGSVDWTRNLDASGEATLVLPHQAPIEFRAALLPDGEERRRVIGVTWHQQLFPGNLLYWLARRHVLAVGRYYRIEPRTSPVCVTHGLALGGPCGLSDLRVPPRPARRPSPGSRTWARTDTPCLARWR